MRAGKTLHGISGLRVIEHKASMQDGKIAEYRVTMEATFILPTAPQSSPRPPQPRALVSRGPVVKAALCMKPHGLLTAHQIGRAGVELLRARVLPHQPTKFHTD
jgi:hypothetical protein